VEYLRRHAGLGLDSNPAEQCRIQLHVAVYAARVIRRFQIVDGYLSVTPQEEGRKIGKPNASGRKAVKASVLKAMP
jgi:hypothetical protein